MRVLLLLSSDCCFGVEVFESVSAPSLPILLIVWTSSSESSPNDLVLAQKHGKSLPNMARGGRQDFSPIEVEPFRINIYYLTEAY
jgi:hypothetical protein